MKKIILFIFLSLLIGRFFVSCSWDPTEHEMDHFYIRNLSSDTVYCVWTHLSDSTQRINSARYPNDMIEPSGFIKASNHLLGNREEHYFQIDFWKKSTLDKYSIDELEEEAIFDKRVLISYKELERMNFCIIFE